MLSPDHRSLYTSALTPPPGYCFDEGIGTTFSLDPSTLLGIPIHLALGRFADATPVRDGIAAYEALRRVADRLTVYAQRGRLLVPGKEHLLYGLLEDMVVEVKAPRGGVFHPKLWVLRFVDSLGEQPPMIRLLVLSRNLTEDRSWDLALQLEGTVGRRNIAANRELGDLVAALPGLAFEKLSMPERQAQAERLGDELKRVKWELPKGFDEVKFYALGLGTGHPKWWPEYAREMAVISPFCTDEALSGLAGTTERPRVLIARPEEIAALSPETLARFEACYVLDEAAETADGEDTEAQDSTGAALDTFGLHAKAYLFRRGWDTHVVMGSANATNAALIAGKNVEILAELVGKRSAVGSIDTLLGPDGLGEVLRPFEPPSPPSDDEIERQEALKDLEEARELLAGAAWALHCAPTDEGTWHLNLVAPELAALSGVASVRVWPLSVLSARAHDAAALWRGEPLILGPYAAVSLTGLLGFELMSTRAEVGLRFALNLPVANLPENRDTELLRLVVENADGFLRYLLLLLGDDEAASDGRHAAANSGASWGAMGLLRDSDALLEPLTRAYARDPGRLQEITTLVRRLRSGDGEALIPPEFDALWNVFETALEARSGK